ncbi:glutamate--tRNA ligase [Marinobacterium zhoushanense]|uniref:Glutamate--tRNA ligase n=1 Tax=Marinobacterium zhoushanense TaxID=1679163 RepID=A0ABQ1K6H8_9GAMM|nr:glutamate--tRNA ligase [Marinobacterium zhoushanense]GGB89507.1 glutamate--tRNA ligase [Marinobacterium zhoushanense]
MTVRTRIAPSPTGDPHVGTAYIALFNLAFARQHGGQFILRIEDTDQTRSTPESEQAILDSLRWLGLEWDEGPDVGGEHGPYRQSERKAMYKDFAMRLVEEDKAFLCFRTADELNDLREQLKASGAQRALKQQDLELPADEVERRMAAGEPYVVRMKVPTEGVCEIDDMLRGTMELDWAQVDAQILLKSDGMPTYHLANIVDDHLMKITHVIRGEEWINSAPKHKLLYEYFGWDMPKLCHMPLLRNPDKSKLSKRKNPTSILYYQRMGYMPEALLNYLGRMGWSMPDEREKFSREEMFAAFDIQRVSLGGPVFDQEKLSWLNGLWIRENLSPEQFAARVQEWALNSAYLSQIIPLIQPRVEKFSDVAPLAGFFLSGMMPVSEASFEHKKLSIDDVRRILQFASWYLDELRHWDRDQLFEGLKAVGEAIDFKIRDFLFPLFVAISGTSQSVSVVDAMAILGPDISRARVRHALEVIGGPSKKQAKSWEKEYRALNPG